MKLVTIGQYSNTTLAHIDKYSLEKEGIVSVIEFEHSGSIPEITGNFSSGVLLKVAEKDVKEAQATLEVVSKKQSKLANLKEKINYTKESVSVDTSLQTPKSSFTEYSSLGLEFSLSCIIPICIGFYCDNLWATSPIFIIVGLILGFMIGIYKLILFSRKN